VDAHALGYTAHDLQRLTELAPGGVREPRQLERVIDSFGYLAEWKKAYRIQSVRSSLHSTRITCIDAAILSYGLLELLFGDVKRRLLAIHRRAPNGEECGHCVTLYWGADGRIGAFSKSSFPGLNHRAPIYDDELQIAATYGEAYLEMGFEPLYFGTTTLEEVAPDLDWRHHPDHLNELSDRLKQRYQYAFMLAH
jgi:hypothetical protein